MDARERALARFGEGFNCAQAVFSAYAEEMGLDAEMALKTAALFGAGMVRTGATCGAVTGALMALGLRHSTADPADRESRERLYRLGQELLEEFQDRHGSILCRELLGLDLSTPEGMQQARERNVAATICPQFVATAAELAGRPPAR